MNKPPRQMIAAAAAVAILSVSALAAWADPVTFEHDRSETAMIAAWMNREWTIDTPFPGVSQFDAVHRRLLVRFPGLAEEAHRALAAGYVIEHAELVLDWAGQDVEVPSGGYVSQGRARDLYRDNPGQWHVLAHALRRPWQAAAARGPTWNAYLDGAGYWRRHGARDEAADRYPTRFGPQPLHAEHRTARLDVTETLTDPAYGATPAERLHGLETRGFILRKLETWDPKYAEPWSSYDWFVATGGHAITIENPRLRLRLAPRAGADPGTLLGPIDLAGLADRLVATGEGGAPPTWRPTDAIDPALAARDLTRPDGMPDWQWQRVQEIRPLGRVRARRPRNLAEFIDVCDGILIRPPRWYLGAGVQDWILFQLRYGDLMPPHMRDHLAAWWEAWLLPEFSHDQLGHPQSDDPLRMEHGRASFYRGFTRRESTVGFNHRAVEGALFGGAFIGARHALDDARWGLENLVLRHWVFRDGSMQDMISGHYTALHLSFQAMFAQYGPEHRDRLMGQAMLDNMLELVISAYHPGLRRIVYSGNRSFPDQVFLTQEGLYYILHTLSRQGALINLAEAGDTLYGMPVVGDHFPGDRVARMSPVQPSYVVNMVDDKPLPYRITAKDSVRGRFTDPHLMERVYLGRNYALASKDLSHGMFPVLGQWRRADRPVGDMHELGSLVAKFEVNDSSLPMPGGVWAQRSQGEGALVNLQHDHTVIMVGTPGMRDTIMSVAGDHGLRSLQTTIGIYSFQPTPTWEIVVDDLPVGDLPATVADGQRIAIRDGVSYVGLIPLDSTDLGRDAAVDITYAFPVLRISQYNLRRAAPVDPDAIDWEAVNRAGGGFVVVLGDAAEHGDFETFRDRLRDTRLETHWREDGVLHVDFTGLEGDRLEIGVNTQFRPSPQHFPITPGTLNDVVPYRRHNGEWPYPPEGILRDTTLSVQGRTGHLEKNGAVFRSRPGQMTYLRTEPISGTTVAYNPLPDPNRFDLTTPEGLIVRADGLLGMARVEVRPADGEILVNYEIPAEPDIADGMARRLLVSHLETRPRVTLNGEPLDTVASVHIDGRQAFSIPLRHDAN